MKSTEFFSYLQFPNYSLFPQEQIFAVYWANRLKTREGMADVREHICSLLVCTSIGSTMRASTVILITNKYENLRFLIPANYQKTIPSPEWRNFRFRKIT